MPEGAAKPSRLLVLLTVKGEVKVDIRELRIDTYLNSGHTVQMKVTHEPTGVSVNGSGVFRLKLKERLISEIVKKVKAAADS